MNYYKTRKGRILTKDEVEKSLKKYNSQKEAASYLGVSQMTISRAKIFLNIKHDGKVLANKDPDKIKRQSDSIKKGYEDGSIIKYWQGKKMSPESIEKRSKALRGKPTWNSGYADNVNNKDRELVSCKICNKEFFPLKSKKRKFCGKKCTNTHMSLLYSGEKLKGIKNPNFNNRGKIREAMIRGCYDNRPLPKHSWGEVHNYKGYRMRSSWEFEYAKLLDRNNITWEYESKKFKLSDGRIYHPDFYLIDEDKYIEIKGFWTSKAKEKFKKFKNEYPNINIEVIEKEIWKD